jgi:anti-anti-sigma factor
MATATADHPIDAHPAPPRRPSVSPRLRFSASVNEEGHVTIRLSGNVDIYSVAALRRRMARFEATARLVTLDLSRVPLIDSAGLGTLQSFANRARRNGDRLGLICSPGFAELLHITHLDDAFDIAVADETGT